MTARRPGAAREPDGPKSPSARYGPAPASPRTALFAATVFLGAFLLFLVQPMAGKALLPVMGGSPAVWNACMLFFQVALLFGYAAAHAGVRWIPRRALPAAFAALLGLGLFFLPLRIVRGDPGALDPSLWVIGALAVSVLAPFAAVAAAGPLVQRWFAGSATNARRDPYVLYAASNLGSFAGLLAYPLLVEPFLPLGAAPGGAAGGALTQTLVWSLGYGALAAGALALGFGAVRKTAPADFFSSTDPGADAPGIRARLAWIALAAIPSSLVLGTTLEITTDVAAVPMLWIVPLAVYLLTYVVAFAWPKRLPVAWTGVALAALATVIGALRWNPARVDPLVSIALHLAALAAAGLVCHGTLARSRPHPARMTEFYLLIAAGGAIGGLFNALVAPRLFDGVAEYPAALVLACLARPAGRFDGGGRRYRLLLDVALPLVLAGAAVVTLLTMRPGPGNSTAPPRVLAILLVAGAVLSIPRRFGFAATLAVLFAGSVLAGAKLEERLYEKRTFFGVLKVVKSYGTPFHMTGSSDDTSRRVDSHELFHGTTRHGRQLLEPKLERVATSYYHRSGPIGRLFRALAAADRPLDVGIVGLGVGTLAAYGRPEDRFTFFEIDEEIERIARDPRLFTFLANARASIDVRIGDGRRLVARSPRGRLDLLVVDAFTSDAVPVHFLTREAFEVWAAALQDRGLLALHLSSIYFDLVPVAAAGGAAAGLTGFAWTDTTITPQQRVEEKAPSIWVVLAKSSAALSPVPESGPWQPLAPAAPETLWTDDQASPLRALRRFAP